MGLLDRFLKKKEKKVEEKKETAGTCIVCNNPIYKGEEYKTISFQGQKYLVHLKCFRKAKKMAKKYISSGFRL